MADTDATPMTDLDIETPPSTTEFRAAPPLKDAAVDFEPGEAVVQDGRTSDRKAGEGVAPLHSVKEGANRLGGQATDRIRAFAQDGQARAGGALDQLVQMLTDAAGQVDGKLGDQYGDYARQAANTVSGLSDTVKNKDVDELFDDARTFVRKSPGLAIGAAAAVGFVVARLVQSGVEAERASAADTVDADRG